MRHCFMKFNRLQNGVANTDDSVIHLQHASGSNVLSDCCRNKVTVTLVARLCCRTMEGMFNWLNGNKESPRDRMLISSIIANIYRVAKK